MATKNSPDVQLFSRAKITKRSDKPKRVLIVGNEAHPDTTGYSADNMDRLHENITSDNIPYIFCKGSTMARAGLKFKSINQDSELDMIALKADTTGDTPTQARGIIKITPITGGTGATESVNLRIHIISPDIYEDVQVVKGDTGKKIADKIKSAFDKYVISSADVTQNILTSATAAEPETNAGEVTLKLSERGKFGNDRMIYIDGGKDSIPGCTVTVTNFTEAIGSYVSTDLFSKIGVKKYDWIVFNHQIVRTQDMSDFLHEQGMNASEDLRGIGISIRDDFGADALILDMEDIPRNHKRLWTIANIPENRTLSDPMVLAAELAAKKTLEQTAGADASSIVTNMDDAIGGDHNASLPLWNIEVEAIATTRTLTRDKENKLNNAGISLLKTRGSRVYTGEAFTRYAENDNGVEDDTFKYLSTVLLTDAIDSHIFSVFSGEQFFRARFSKNKRAGARNTYSQLDIANVCTGMFDYLALQDLIEIGYRQQFIDTVKESLTAEGAFDMSAGKFVVQMPFVPIGQLRAITAYVTYSKEGSSVIWE